MNGLSRGFASILGALAFSHAWAGEWQNHPEESIIEESESTPSFDYSLRSDVEGSVLFGDGITLSEYSLYTQLTSDPFDLGITLSYDTYEIDYEPEIFGRATKLSTSQDTIAFDGRLTLGDHWNLIGTASYYDGYADYRSLWISEYYDQLFGAVDGYIDPSPKGVSFSLGLEWEYIPVMAKVRLTGGYSKDTIAPAYDFGENGLVRSRPDLYTNFFQLQTENVLTNKLVMQNTFQYTNTTNREKRWSARTALNYAINDRLFMRFNGGFAVEQPTFDAYYAGLSLEYQFIDNWFLRLNGRYYEDTGEIENSLGGFTSSAPALESFELGAGLRWQGVNSALNLYVAYYQTEYEPLAEDNAFLQNLYNDRRWGIVQLSYTYNF